MKFTIAAIPIQELLATFCEFLIDDVAETKGVFIMAMKGDMVKVSLKTINKNTQRRMMKVIRNIGYNADDYERLQDRRQKPNEREIEVFQEMKKLLNCDVLFIYTSHQDPSQDLVFHLTPDDFTTEELVSTIDQVGERFTEMQHTETVHETIKRTTSTPARISN